MTHAVTLTGQWEGLRAFPRASRTPDHRQRLETGLDKLSGLYEAMSARAALLRTGLERLEGLRAGLIDQLDAMDAPTIDLEPTGDDEPSLCHPGCWGFDDLEMQCDDEGGDTEDRGEPNLGWGFDVDQRKTHSSPNDMEEEHDGREPDADSEPDSDGEPGDEQGLACDWGEDHNQTRLTSLGVALKRPAEAHPAVAPLIDRTAREMRAQGLGHLAPRPKGPFLYLIGPGSPSPIIGRL